MNRVSRLLLMLTLAAGSLAGCNVSLQVGQPGGDGDRSDGGLQVADDALADFSLIDVNPESARFQESVSPRDYLGEVSAWYFGHST